MLTKSSIGVLAESQEGISSCWQGLARSASSDLAQALALPLAVAQDLVPSIGWKGDSHTLAIPLLPVMVMEVGLQQIMWAVGGDVGGREQSRITKLNATVIQLVVCGIVLSILPEVNVLASYF